MADVVTTQVMINGARNLIIKFTNESDGTGETNVVKVDATSATYANQGTVPGVHLKVARIIFNINAGAVRIRWDQTTDTDMVILTGFGTMDFSIMGGLPNPQGAGATGSILFTTVGFASGSSYTIDLEMLKCVAP